MTEQCLLQLWLVVIGSPHLGAGAPYIKQKKLAIPSCIVTNDTYIYVLGVTGMPRGTVGELWECKHKQLQYSRNAWNIWQCLCRVTQTWPVTRLLNLQFCFYERECISLSTYIICESFLVAYFISIDLSIVFCCLFEACGRDEMLCVHVITTVFAKILCAYVM